MFFYLNLSQNPTCFLFGGLTKTPHSKQDGLIRPLHSVFGSPIYFFFIFSKVGSIMAGTKQYIMGCRSKPSEIVRGPSGLNHNGHYLVGGPSEEKKTKTDFERILLHPI